MTEPRIPQEPDRVRPVPALLLMVVSVGLIGLGIWWPWHILAGETARRAAVEAGTSPRTGPVPRQVQSLRQTLIEEENVRER